MNSSNVLVSLIIACYNSEKYISETIESALKQTWQNKEIIIVDDGSTDSSYSIIKQYQSERVRIFKQVNAGASAARNKGLMEAKGEYVQFLDSDDLLGSDKIEKQMSILSQKGDCIISCKWVRFRNNVQNTFGAIGPHPSIATDLDPLDWLVTRHTMLIHGWLTPRKLIDLAGWWNEALSLNDDGEFFCRVVSKAKKVLYCPETTVFYRSENPNSLSSFTDKNKYYSAYFSGVSYKEVLYSLSDVKNLGQVKQAIGNYFKELEYLLYPSYPELVKLCRKQPEISYSNVIWKPGGMTQVTSKIFGWKFAKCLKELLIGINKIKPSVVLAIKIWVNRGRTLRVKGKGMW